MAPLLQSSWQTMFVYVAQCRQITLFSLCIQIYNLISMHFYGRVRRKCRVHTSVQHGFYYTIKRTGCVYVRFSFLEFLMIFRCHIVTKSTIQVIIISAIFSIFFFFFCKIIGKQRNYAVKRAECDVIDFENDVEMKRDRIYMYIYRPKTIFRKYFSAIFGNCIIFFLTLGGHKQNCRNYMKHFANNQFSASMCPLPNYRKRNNNHRIFN